MVEKTVEGMVEVAIDEAVKGIIIIIAESTIAKIEYSGTPLKRTHWDQEFCLQ